MSTSRIPPNFLQNDWADAPHPERTRPHPAGQLLARQRVVVGIPWSTADAHAATPPAVRPPRSGRTVMVWPGAGASGVLHQTRRVLRQTRRRLLLSLYLLNL